MTTVVPPHRWPAEGLTRVPYWVYSDRDVYDAEQARIFQGPTWNFLCLEAELPSARAGATDLIPKMMGTLNGEITATTPTGRRRASESRGSSLGISSPYARLGSAAAS